MAARQEVAEELARWKARAEALRLALETARAKAGADHLAGVEGALGTLLDLIEVDEGWEKSVEAALGDALLAVVVADPSTGRRALQSLRESNVQGAVLALGLHTGPVAPIPVGGDPVRPHVRSRTATVERLLDVIEGYQLVVLGACDVVQWDADHDHRLVAQLRTHEDAKMKHAGTNALRLFVERGLAASQLLRDRRSHKTIQLADRFTRRAAARPAECIVAAIEAALALGKARTPGDFESYAIHPRTHH